MRRCEAGVAGDSRLAALFDQDGAREVVVDGLPLREQSGHRELGVVGQPRLRELRTQTAQAPLEISGWWPVVAVISQAVRDELAEVLVTTALMQDVQPIVDVAAMSLFVARGATQGLAQDELEEHGTQGVDVSGVGVDAIEAFGSHVGQRAEEDGPGHRLAVLELSAGHPEVEDLDLAGAGELHIAGLDVSVENLEWPTVLCRKLECGVERTGNLLDDLQGTTRRYRPLAQQLLEIDAVDELHDHGPATVEQEHAVDLDHRPVAQQAQHARLVPQTLGDVLVFGELGVQHLERHALGEAPRVHELGTVHGAESALPDGFEDMIATAFCLHLDPRKPPQRSRASTRSAASGATNR